MALRIIDSLAQRGEPFILLLGRLCMGSLYLMAGVNHWRNLTRLTHFMTGLPGGVDAWAMLTATIEVASGLALVLGFLTREFALLHPYWSINGDANARWAQFIGFWKDIGLAGGALFLLARGAGRLSLDRKP
jgi:putative oxidoreductase